MQGVHGADDRAWPTAGAQFIADQVSEVTLFQLCSWPPRRDYDNRPAR